MTTDTRALITIIAAGLGLEVLSALGWLVTWPWLMPLLWVAVVLAVAVATIRQTEYGLYAVLFELFVGAKGHLLTLAVTESFSISLRIGIFAVVMLVWAGQGLYQWYTTKQWPETFLSLRHSRWWKHYLLLLLVIAWAVLWGVGRGNGLTAVALDANAWVYFLLALPLYDHLRGQAQQRLVVLLLIAAVSITCIKTIATFLAFTQELPDSILRPLYYWLRNSGVGEITYAGQGNDSLWRVFFQSQLYSLAAWAMASVVLLGTKTDQLRGWWIWIWLASSYTVVLSLSRSFWVGAAAAAVVVIGWYLWHHRGQWPRLMIGLIIMVAVVTVQYQSISWLAGGGSGALIAERVTGSASEAAGASRLAQVEPLISAIVVHPVIGSGFGTAVTYQSQDPRIVERYPDGWYTTTAFELGYLDIWLKIGLVGLLVYLWLLARLWGHSVASERPYIAAWAVILVAIAATSAFSPYLNHPLGIGVVAVMMTLQEHN